MPDFSDIGVSRQSHSRTGELSLKLTRDSIKALIGKALILLQH